MTITKKTIERVKAVNNTLLSIGYSWDRIELFWKECIEKAKENDSRVSN